MSQANILIVEDDPTIAIDIKLNLKRAGYIVVDTVDRAEEVIPIISTKAVDVVLLDIHLAGSMTGIELAAELHQRWRIPFIFLSSYADEDTLQRAAHTFPASYLVKPFKEIDLVPAIKMALIRSIHKPSQQMPNLAYINRELISQITPTEYKVMSAAWQGHSNEQISQDFSISRNTVKTHFKNIYLKLDLNSRTGLIDYLRRLM